MLFDPKALREETLTLNDGNKIPVIGLGTWQLEGEACLELIPKALKVGYRHIDTAKAYHNHAQIAPALKSYARDELFITSKLLGAFHAHEISAACDEILLELGIDYLDLFLVHWPIRAIPFSETLGAFADLKMAGKIRSIGVSNFTIRHLKDAFACGVIPAVQQIEFHPYFNQKEMLAFCQQHNIAVTAYSPLAQGMAATDPVLMKIGESYQRTACQVALRWLLQKGIVAIPRSANEKELVENADVFHFSLSTEDMKTIDQLDQQKRLVSGLYADWEYV